MRILKTFSTITLTFAVSACVVIPVMDKDDSTSTCKTYTKSMKLDVVVADRGSCGDQYCLAAAVAVFAGSAIISGSIVLTGNTVHWLEYQGTCEDSYLNSAKQRFFDSINKPKSTPET